MRADSEGRWKGEKKISRLSHSLPSSFQVDICDSDSAEEMDQMHSKLGAKPKWWPQRQSRDCQNSQDAGVKQQYEALLRKHAIEYTKLMEEYEEMKAAGDGKMKTSRRKRKDRRRRLRRSFLWSRA